MQLSGTPARLVFDKLHLYIFCMLSCVLFCLQVSSCRCVADAHGLGGGDIEAEANEQAAAVASAALAALSSAKVRPSSSSAKQQPCQQQQDTDADEPDQRPSAKNKQQGNGTQQKQQQQQQQQGKRQKSPGMCGRKAAGEDSDGTSSYSDVASSSESDAGSVQLTVSFASSSEGYSDDGSSSSAGSVSDAEASQPCWGAAAGAQQLLEPGLAWASGACASAALELVPKPAILAAVGELVLRVEEEQCRQAAARHFGVQQVGRL
jgi:hypothetical protein